MERHIAGESIRQISREEGRARETVTKIVRSNEMHRYVSELRERVYGLGEAAYVAVQHALLTRKDPRLGYRLLSDIGAVPSPLERQPIPANREVIEKESLNPFELLLAENEKGEINASAVKLARIAQDRAEAYGMESPTVEQMRHDRMVADAIDEATSGRGLELSLSNPGEWHRLKAMVEEKFREFKEQAKPARYFPKRPATEA